MSSSRPRIRLRVELESSDAAAADDERVTHHNHAYCVRRTRESALGTPRPRIGVQADGTGMCQVCKLVTAHGRCPASPPVYALFTFLVRMLKRRIRTMRHHHRYQTSHDRSRQHENPTVPRDWTESKFHCCGFRGILAKKYASLTPMSTSSVKRRVGLIRC